MITPQIERAISHLASRGMPLHTATGVVASLAGESGRKLNTSAVGDGGEAYGIGQWHPDRQRNFARAMGRPIQGSSLEQQLDFLLWELNNTEKRAKSALMQASNPMQAAAAFTAKFERPQDIPGEAAKRANIAAKLAGRVMQPIRQQYAANGYAGTMTDVPPQDAVPSLAEFAAARSKVTAPQDSNIPPSLAEFAASRRKGKELTTPFTSDGNQPPEGFNPNPIAKRNAAEPTATAPQVDALTAFGAGALRGLADLPAGLNELNDKIAAVNPMSRMMNAVTGGIPDAIRQTESDMVRNLDQQYEADYQQKYGKSGSAKAGRIGGNVATAFIPGTGQAKAAQGIGNLVKAGKTGQAMLAGADLGGMQSAVLSGGDPAQTAVGATIGGLVPGITGATPLMPKAKAGQLISQRITDVPIRRLMDKGLVRAAAATATHGGSEVKRLVDDLVRARVQGSLDMAKTDPQKMYELLTAFNKSASSRGSATRTGLLMVPAMQGLCNDGQNHSDFL